MLLSSTDDEIHSTFAGVKKAVYFFEMAKILDVPNTGKPIRIYQDSQWYIDMITSGTVSKHFKHITVPVHYVYEKFVKGIVHIEHIPTALQPADPGTKLTTNVGPCIIPCIWLCNRRTILPSSRFWACKNSWTSLLTILLVHSPFLIHPKILPFQYQQPLPSRMSNEIYLPPKFFTPYQMF